MGEWMEVWIGRWIYRLRFRNTKTKACLGIRILKKMKTKKNKKNIFIYHGRHKNSHKVAYHGRSAERKE